MLTADAFTAGSAWSYIIVGAIAFLLGGGVTVLTMLLRIRRKNKGDGHD